MRLTIIDESKDLQDFESLDHKTEREERFTHTATIEPSHSPSHSIDQTFTSLIFFAIHLTSSPLYIFNFVFSKGGSIIALINQVDYDEKPNNTFHYFIGYYTG